MTGIEWTDETWNPVVGCSKVSPGCAHCYAEEVHRTRLSGRGVYPTFAPWVPENAEHNVALAPERLDQPLRWTKPRMVFVNSMSDLFHERLTGLPSEQAKTEEDVERDLALYAQQDGEPRRPDYIAQIFAVMSMATQHTFQVLTKRPKAMALLLSHPHFWLTVNGERMKRMTPVLPGKLEVSAEVYKLPNVWLGTSIENRHFLDRADWLKQAPAAVHFISAEPLLGPLTGLDAMPEQAAADEVLDRVSGLTPMEGGLDLKGIDWLIVGGESGAKYRRMEAKWARDLREKAAEAGTAFFFKQWGGRTPKAGGRELDGRTWDEMPAVG